MELHYGVVEDRNDPEYMGRAKVRVVGIHTQNVKKYRQMTYHGLML